MDLPAGMVVCRNLIGELEVTISCNVTLHKNDCNSAKVQTVKVKDCKIFQNLYVYFENSGKISREI